MIDSYPHKSAQSELKCLQGLFRSSIFRFLYHRVTASLSSDNTTDSA